MRDVSFNRCVKIWDWVVKREMMDYRAIRVKGLGDLEADILTAYLARYAFNCFERKAGDLYAYMTERDFKKEQAEIATCLSEYDWEPQRLSPDFSSWVSDRTPLVLSDFLSLFYEKGAEQNARTPYALYIEEGLCFGNGKHPTTRMVLETLKTLPLRDKRVLDMGTGTGILALVAAKLGAHYVRALDNDAVALACAQRNAAYNHCSEIQFSLASELPEGPPYDIIFCNIYLNFIKAHLTSLCALLSEGGYLLLSGFFKEQVAEVLALLPVQRSYRTIEREGWVLLVISTC